MRRPKINTFLNTCLLVFSAVFFVWNVPMHAWAQRPLAGFENITSKEGLADRAVNAIVQDGRGFIWIGSLEGLTRYDGYTCVTYRHEADDPYSLSDNEIYALCTDGDGAVWIGTRQGLNKFDYTNNRFIVFLHNSSDDNSVSNNEIFSLAKDPEGNLWVGTFGGGLNRVIKKGIPTEEGNEYRFIHYRHSDKDSNSISDDQINSICFNGRKEVWIGTSNGLNMLQSGTGRFIRFYKSSHNSNAIGSNMITKVFRSKDGSLWICGKGMLDNIVRKGGQDSLRVAHILPLLVKSKNLDNCAVNDFIIDKEGNGWMATNNQGLYKLAFAPDKGIRFCEHFLNNGQLSSSLASSTVYCSFEDCSGVIWVGTAKGVSKYVPAKERFHRVNRLIKSLPENKRFVMALLADKQNRLWMAYDSDTLQVITRKENQSSIETVILATVSGNVSNEINVLFQNAAGDLYIGTLRGGIFILPKRFQHAYHAKNWIRINTTLYSALPSNNIYAIAEDAKGIIWMGTYKGLCTYNPYTKQIQRVYTNQFADVSSDYIIRTIRFDDRNNIWCGTDNGIYMLKNGAVIKSFKNIRQDSTSLSNNRVTACYIDHERNIWIGTKQGLNLYNPVLDNFKRISLKDGLPNDGIRSLQQDAAGNLWVGTNHGLVRISVDSKRIDTYGLEDGLISDQFMTNSVCKDTAGISFFGTNNGLLSFQPENITLNKSAPPIAIVNTKVMNVSINAIGDSVLLKTFRRENKLVLQYNQNFFSFEFAALNYVNSPSNQYAYILEGVDRQWNYAGTQRFAGYTDIAPGRYVFKVKGSNNDGIWNNSPATVEVIIIPPWWRTWWFYALCFLAAGSLVYLIYTIRLRQMLKLYKLRSSIAKDLHDDVGSALSSIALLSSIAQDGKTNSRLKHEEIVARIGNTSKKMIDQMDDIVWSVNPANDRFSNMLVRMREYAAEMLEAKNISFIFTLAANADDVKIPMQIRKDYFLIFKEAINNLAKYSSCGRASISIERISRTLITTIHDDGQGFDPAYIHSGNGIKNMHERAKIIKGKLSIETWPGKGTRVMLEMPVT